MPTEGPSSPTNVVDSDCQSTIDDDNITKALDNSDEAELSTVDESVNNDEALDHDEESATNHGNDRDTSYQDVAAVDDTNNNDAGVEQQQHRVGGQDENNSNVQTNNVVRGEKSAESSHGADEQRTTITEDNGDGEDDGNDQVVDEIQTEIEQVKDSDFVKIAGIMEKVLKHSIENSRRIDHLESENNESNWMIQELIDGLEGLSKRLETAENDNTRNRKHCKKLSKTIKVVKTLIVTLRGDHDLMRDDVDNLLVDVAEIKSKLCFSKPQSLALKDVLTPYCDEHGANMDKWPKSVWDEIYPRYLAKVEADGIGFDQAPSIEAVMNHSRNSTVANPRAINWSQLEDIHKVFLITYLLENGRSWKQASDALLAEHGVLIKNQTINNQFSRTLMSNLLRLGTTADVDGIVSTVRDKLLIGDALPIDDAKKVVTKLLPNLSFPALETSEISSASEMSDMSVGSSIVSVSDTMKSGTETLTATTTSSTDGDMSSLDLTTALSTPRSSDLFHSDGAGHVLSPRGDLLSPRGDTITFPTPKFSNKSSKDSFERPSGDTTSSSAANSSRVEEGEVATESSSAAHTLAAATTSFSGNAVTTSSAGTLDPVVEEVEIHTAAATTTVSTTDTTSNIKSATTSLELAMVVSCERAGHLLISPRDATVANRTPAKATGHQTQSGVISSEATEDSSQAESSTAESSTAESSPPVSTQLVVAEPTVNPAFGDGSLFDAIQSEEQSKTVRVHLRKIVYPWSRNLPPPSGPSPEQCRRLVHLFNSDDFKNKEEALAMIRWLFNSDTASWNPITRLRLIERAFKMMMTSFTDKRGTLVKASAMVLCSIMFKCDTEEIAVKLMPAIVLAGELLDRCNADSITGSNMLSFIVMNCKSVRVHPSFVSFLCKGAISKSSSRKRKVHCIEALEYVLSSYEIKVSSKVGKNNASGLEPLRFQIVKASKEATTSYTGWLEKTYPVQKKNKEIRGKLENCHKKLAAAVQKNEKLAATMKNM